MPVQHIVVGVVAIKAKLNNKWVDYEWRPHSVLDDAPDLPPMTMLSREGENELWYLGPAELIMHSGETSHYRDNLVSGRPSVWVAVRINEDGSPRIGGASLDPYEGEAFAEVIEDRIEALPMPARAQAALQAFFDTHHVETEFFKRKRDRLRERGLDEFGVGHPARARAERKPS